MAGNGSRFAESGYAVPKPMIDVAGKPMFIKSIESINLSFDDYIFIVRKEHNITTKVLEYYPNAKIVELDHVTEGAACSVLLADDYLNDDDSIFVSNCDQIIDWDSTKFNNKKDSDGVIMLFNEPNRDPKWSFADYDHDTESISKVAEKDPISEWATSGHYYWKEWKTYKQSAQAMINSNDRINGEFYLCPVYNYTINQLNKTVKGVIIDRMHGVGTPEDLEKWLNL